MTARWQKSNGPGEPPYVRPDHPAAHARSDHHLADRHTHSSAEPALGTKAGIRSNLRLSGERCPDHRVACTSNVQLGSCGVGPGISVALKWLWCVVDVAIQCHRKDRKIPLIDGKKYLIGAWKASPGCVELRLEDVFFPG